MRRCAWCGLLSGNKFGICPDCESLWQSRCIDETKLPWSYDFSVHRLFISKNHESIERSLAVLLKGDEQVLLWKYFARLFLTMRLVSSELLPQNPIIVSAPSSTGRLHAQLFGDAISELTGWLHSPLLNCDTNKMRAQKGLGRKERMSKQLKIDSKNSFKFNSVIFVDDLFATGGTANAAFNALNTQSFEVWALVHQLLLH